MKVGRRQFLLAGATPLLMAAAGTRVARAAADKPIPVQAKTTLGPVLGKPDRGALAFKGIPYGASTSGSGRFMAPTLPTRWKEPYPAFEHGPISPQHSPDSRTPAGQVPAESEDCLRLNVWTPALRDGRKRPVMVWLHGGGLWRLSAAGAYQDGAVFAGSGDVVMVSPNHRLNVLGFAYLDEFDSRFSGSSSAGMLDLVLALEWVRDNIEEFGGDPDNVTIFGQSGGGQKVSLLMAMPAAHGLFHKAIIQSGPAPLALEKPYARELATLLLGELAIPKRRAADLQRAPLPEVMRAYYAIFRKIGGFGVMGVIQDFAPVVDGVVLPQHPFWNGASPLSRQIPLMIGNTRTEMTEYFLDQHPDAPKRDFATMTAQLEPIFGADAASIVDHYRKAHTSAGPWEIDSLIRSDWPTRLFTQRIADEQSRTSTAGVWRYRMDWQTKVRDGLLMSPHAIDIPFVLKTIGTDPIGPGQEAENWRMAQQMSSAWISFARDGYPHDASFPKWTPYEEQTRPTMLFNLESAMASDPNGADMAKLASGISHYTVVAGGVTSPSR